MLKANTKNVLSILLPLTLAILCGCSGPEEKRTARLNEVKELRNAGDYNSALAALDALSNEYPNDATILRQIGSLHQLIGNEVEAAFYLSAAYSLSPNDVELLYQTYRAQEDANQPTAAAPLLEQLALLEPDAISNELWLRLGAFRAEANQTQSALDAYLKGVDPENTAPAAETAVAIGTLFKQLNNMPQAERWYNIAANTDDPDALPALFGLLEINLRNKNWTAAEDVIEQVDLQFPGAVDASIWLEARNELVQWRKDQTAMQAKFPQSAETVEAITTITPIEVDDLNNSETANSTPGGKAQIIEDLEHAEAMADTPAIEVAEVPENNTTITYNPNIAIQPAEPALTFDVSFDQETTGGTIDYSVENTDLAKSIAPDVTIESIRDEPALNIQPAQTPRSLEELLASAESETDHHEYKQAIQIYWQALGRANDRADIWNLLSLAYRLDGQTKNAETTALEATRLAPEEINYTLDYLRVVQRSKTQEDFLAELETAYDRFPRSPEIALSLARGYERINGNNSNAIILYERFIQLAPNHPLRPEAETALSRLR